jgi:hypothetical protein
MRILRRALTYSNVVSTLCLFLLLGGGTAVALSGTNTVFSDDIVNAQVKAVDLANGAVTKAKLAPGLAPAKIDFHVPHGTGQTTLFNREGLKITAECAMDTPTSATLLVDVFDTAGSGSFNMHFFEDGPDANSPGDSQYGQTLSKGQVALPLDLTSGSTDGFSRAEGQFVYSNSKAVFTIPFHAEALGDPVNRCQLEGVVTEAS